MTRAWDRAARWWDYPSEEEALVDALRLAQGMARKASLSGLDTGGAKTVIQGVGSVGYNPARILHQEGAENAGGLISAYIDWKKSGTEGIMEKVQDIEDRIE
jgi:leucine dehydrogenase